MLGAGLRCGCFRQVQSHLRHLWSPSPLPSVSPPGSREERGLLAWSQIQENSEEPTQAAEVYGFPCRLGSRTCVRSSCTRWLPFWPRLEEHKVGVSQLDLCPQGTHQTRM